jgi:hypothetical protein
MAMAELRELEDEPAPEYTSRFVVVVVVVVVG